MNLSRISQPWRNSSREYRRKAMHNNMNVYISGRIVGFQALVYYDDVDSQNHKVTAAAELNDHLIS